MKIVSVVGARPQFIKAAVVSGALKGCGIVEVLVHTGQHYDFNMSDIFFKELNLPEPAHHLGVGSGGHGQQTGRMLERVEKILMEERPDMTLVYGDTNSTLAGALASVKLHIPVAHVEAGLRSFNKLMPEEMNRVLVDHMAHYLFAPTQGAVENLKKESLVNDVYNVGDVMLDVAMRARNLVDDAAVLKRYSLEKKQFALVTIHRAENTDSADNLSEIWRALEKIARSGKKVFFPVHPRTQKTLMAHGLLSNAMARNLMLTEPVSYFDMTALESNARVIITDSGGVQKEGYFFKTPCVIPRDETEWVELTERRWARLAGADECAIYEMAMAYWKAGAPDDGSGEQLYGSGNAAEKLVHIIMDEFGAG